MTSPLDDIDLVIFDKDGTLIDFGSMWGGWAVALAAGLHAATGQSIETPLFAMLGYDPATDTVRAGGGLAATPMARLRDRTRDVLIAAGVPSSGAETALEDAWHAPDPVGLAHPLADLDALFGWLRASGRRIAIATTDDRAPTERTLEALDLSGWIDGFVCADDGVPVKPAPGMVLRLCAALRIEPERCAVVGDSVADLAMGRAAGAGRCIGVLSGTGGRADLEPLADVVLDSVAELRPASS